MDDCNDPADCPPSFLIGPLSCATDDDGFILDTLDCCRACQCCGYVECECPAVEGQIGRNPSFIPASIS
jgi:hypothetical protein